MAPIDRPDLEGLDASPPVTERDIQIAELQSALTEEKDARREDRFIFIMVCIILLDAMLFTVMDNWIAPIVLVALEFVVLIPLARRLGVEEAVRILSRFLDRLAASAKNGE